MSINPESIYFIIAFVAPMIWFRTLFAFVPIYFKRPLTRSVLKVRWHHLHHGVLFVIASAVMLLLFPEKRIVTVILLGIGLGSIMDLFIPSLLLQTNREEELVVYRNSLVPTIILFAGILLLLFLLYSFSL